MLTQDMRDLQGLMKPLYHSITCVCLRCRALDWWFAGQPHTHMDSRDRYNRTLDPLIADARHRITHRQVREALDKRRAAQMPR